jgi:hypothetical protein
LTTTEMLPAIGAPVLVTYEDIRIQATVVNVKQSYGRARLLIRPTAGTGEQWVELPRVTLQTDNAAIRGMNAETLDNPVSCTACGELCEFRDAMHDEGYVYCPVCAEIEGIKESYGA